MIDWDELVRREGSAVWRTIYRLVQNQADADECFQETFVSALEVSDGQLVRSWPALLQRLATSRAVDRIRQRLRRLRQEELTDLVKVESSEVGPSHRAEMAELSTKLRWALAQLSAKQAEVFCLHELDGWSYEAIGDQFGMTVNAVGVQLHRTRKKLQDLWKLQGTFSQVLFKQ